MIVYDFLDSTLDHILTEFPNNGIGEVLCYGIDGTYFTLKVFRSRLDFFGWNSNDHFFIVDKSNQPFIMLKVSQLFINDAGDFPYYPLSVNNQVLSDSANTFEICLGFGATIQSGSLPLNLDKLPRSEFREPSKYYVLSSNVSCKKVFDYFKDKFAP